MSPRFTARQVAWLDDGARRVVSAAVSPAYAKSRGRRFDDYCELMRASGDEPLPFTYRRVARLYFFVFISRKTPSAASINHYSAAMSHAAMELGVPFCSDFDRAKLKALKAGLRRLSVASVRRALALVLALLLRLVAVGGATLADLQWACRALLAHAAMLRLDDHGDDVHRAFLLRSVKQLPCRNFILYVGPGKNKTPGLQPAAIWHSQDMESPGY